MGTNVYAIRKNLSKEIIDLLQQKPSLQTYEEIKDKIEENKIHIGKCSAGWKFLFNHNDWKYYDYTEESIKNFLKSCASIVTEYDELLTVNEFWEKYIEAFKDGWNGEQYYTWELNRAGSDEFDVFNKNEAKKLYNTAKKHSWYEKQYYNDKKIPYDKLDYRFSDCIEFC